MTLGFVQWSSQSRYTSDQDIWQTIALLHLPLLGRDVAAIQSELAVFPRKQSGEFGLQTGLPWWNADWASQSMPETEGSNRWPWIQHAHVPLVTASGGTLRLAARARARYGPNTGIVGEWAISDPLTVGPLNGDPLGAQFTFPGERGAYMPGDTIELVLLADMIEPSTPADNGSLMAGDLGLYGFESTALIFGGSVYDVRYFPPVGGNITMNGVRSNTALIGWRLEPMAAPEPTLVTLRNMTLQARRLTSLSVSVQATGGGDNIPPLLSIDSAGAPGTAGTVQGGLLTFPLDLLVEPEELVHLWINPGTGYSLIPADQTYFAPQLGVSGVGTPSDWLVMEGAYTLSRELYFTSESVGSGSEVLLNSLIDGYSGAALGQMPTKGTGGRLVWQDLPSGGNSGDIEASDLPGFASAGNGQVLTRSGDAVAWVNLPSGGGSGGPSGTLTRLSSIPAEVRTFAYGSGSLGSSSMYSQEAYYDFLVLRPLSFEQLTLTPHNASGLSVEWDGVVLATASLDGVADNSEVTVTLSHRVDIAAGGRVRLRATRRDTSGPSRLMGQLTTGQNTSTYTEAGITVTRWNGADTFDWTNSDYVIPRLRFILGTSVTKEVVGPLAPEDFPVGTTAAAPIRSGFIEVDDAAKTARLVWKFSDGSSKKVDLA